MTLTFPQFIDFSPISSISLRPFKSLFSIPHRFNKRYRAQSRCQRIQSKCNDTLSKREVVQKSSLILTRFLSTVIFATISRTHCPKKTRPNLSYNLNAQSLPRLCTVLSAVYRSECVTWNFNNTQSSRYIGLIPL